MKKCYSLLRWPTCTGCAQQTFTVQNKPAAVAPKEAITHPFSSFLEDWAEENYDAIRKNLLRSAENVVKTETSKHS